MKIHLRNLKNGIPVILIPMAGRTTFTELCIVRGGNRYEINKQLNGISHFVEHMMFKGTEKRPTAQEIAIELEGLGATNNAYTSNEVIGFWVRASCKHFEHITDILADQLLHPLFKKEDIELEKGPVKEEMAMHRSEPSSTASDELITLVYGDQSAGWNILGTEDTIDHLNRDHLLWFRHRHFHANNLVIAVTGKFPSETEVLAVLNAKYGALRHGTIPAFQPVRPTGQGSLGVVVIERDIPQSTFVLALHCPSNKSEELPALGVLSAALGMGMSSRLFREVRERRGLAYDVGTYLHLQSDTGLFLIEGGASGNKVFTALTIIREELKKIASEPILEPELKKVKSMLEGSLHQTLENPQSLANRIATQYITLGRLEPLAKRLARVQAVTAEEVLKLAEVIIRNDTLNLAVVGPHNDASRERFLEAVTF